MKIANWSSALKPAQETPQSGNLPNVENNPELQPQVKQTKNGKPEIFYSPPQDGEGPVVYIKHVNGESSSFQIDGTPSTGLRIEIKGTFGKKINQGVVQDAIENIFGKQNNVVVSRKDGHGAGITLQITDENDIKNGSPAVIANLIYSIIKSHFPDEEINKNNISGLVNNLYDTIYFKDSDYKKLP
jgi:hypothetical protein